MFCMLLGVKASWPNAVKIYSFYLLVLGLNFASEMIWLFI
ncbi:putative membrane protein [Synechococcus sp. ROS8604]|nr:putative membrane protein [Synechococcus sp. ROS8604]